MNKFNPRSIVTIKEKKGVYEVLSVQAQGRGFLHTLKGKKGLYPGRDLIRATRAEVAEYKAKIAALETPADKPKRPASVKKDLAPKPSASLKQLVKPTPVAKVEKALADSPAVVKKPRKVSKKVEATPNPILLEAPSLNIEPAGTPAEDVHEDGIGLAYNEIPASSCESQLQEAVTESNDSTPEIGS